MVPPLVSLKPQDNSISKRTIVDVNLRGLLHILSESRQEAIDVSDVIVPVSSTSTSSTKNNNIRQRMKEITGFSLTAFRSSARAITGISASAIYSSTAVATSFYIRQVLKFILQLCPPALRYFLQPFLVLYFVPLFILRTITNQSRFREEDLDEQDSSTINSTWQEKQHESFVTAWKQAVKKADTSTSYWPIHVDSSTDDFYKDYDELPINDAILESIAVASEKEQLATVHDYNLAFFAKRRASNNINRQQGQKLP
jgi:hypothetical protein